ncbi:MAG: PHP domain-containing protein [Candidatus Cloacimonetes bacterium]|nr:PHP domain-containing protein [Candidatus Cloacimonadota bacterium]MDD4276590.1 PHP domain-containing protein [Candidatus Cloacimonadota bacterium]MDY0325025.1 PHP domain-containing protein [Candidatus Cloacimonadaceae bacterium]
MSFVHLHVHSEYSMLDGACFIDDLVSRAKKLKMPAVAITDRNSIAGASRLWQQCLKARIKPIVGLEIEVLNDLSDGRAFSIILLAKNGDGCQNLARLITLAHEHDPLAPKITKSQLQMNAQNLICLSFSVVGELCTLLLEDRDAEAWQVSDWYRSVFGDDYYYEIQNHGLPQEAIAMNKLLNMAYDSKVPVVLTNDCHYIRRQDSVAIDALNCIRKGIDFSQSEAKRFACNEYYFKTAKEMKSLFDFPPQLTQNTLAIADKIDVTGGYIPVSDGELDISNVLDVFRIFDPTLRIRFKPQSKLIRVSLMGNESAAVLAHLHSKFPDYDILPWTEYQHWTPASIYYAVLRSMNVEEENIKELCELIPTEANTLLEAVLISTDFSCFSSENYLYGAALSIGNRLMDTFRNLVTMPDHYVFIPRNLTVPLVRDQQGNNICQYDKETLNMMGCVTMELILE